MRLSQLWKRKRDKQRKIIRLIIYVQNYVSEDFISNRNSCLNGKINERLVSNILFHSVEAK
jgi:hypothetical protein